MIGKILEATKGKPCSCPTGKICTACKPKKAVRVKPIVVVEGSKALPVPVKITTYKDKTRSVVLPPQRKKTFKSDAPTVLSCQKSDTCNNRWQKPVPVQSANRETAFCRWYNKRKALSDLRAITRLEQRRLAELRHEKARREREAEFLQQLVQREKEIRLAEQQLAETPDVSLPCIGQSLARKGKTKRGRKKRGIKATEVKLCCPDRIDRIYCDNAKKYYSPKKSFSESFSNFCYKVCCQFYCCITFMMIIGLVIIFYY